MQSIQNHKGTNLVLITKCDRCTWAKKQLIYTISEYTDGKKVQQGVLKQVAGLIMLDMISQELVRDWLKKLNEETL